MLAFDSLLPTRLARCFLMLLWTQPQQEEVCMEVVLRRLDLSLAQNLLEARVAPHARLSRLLGLSGLTS